MSQLYDLEKSLNATLELDAVIAMVPAKAIAMLPCQAMNLWLYDGPDLRLVAGEGADDTVELGLIEAPGEGYVAALALSESKIVSTSSRSTPPAINARTCSL